MAYEPDTIADPSNLSTAQLVEYVQRELRKIADTTRLFDEGQQASLGAAPNKPQLGQVVYANGTTWNPGSGAGPYFWDGTAWQFMGPLAVDGSDLFKYYLYGAV